MKIFRNFIRSIRSICRGVFCVGPRRVKQMRTHDEEKTEKFIKKIIGKGKGQFCFVKEDLKFLEHYACIRNYTVQTRIVELIADIEEMIDDPILKINDALIHDKEILEQLIPRDAEIFIKNREWDGMSESCD